MYEPGFFAFTDQLKAISKSGDPLELVERHIDFEVFRPALEAALGYGDRPKGGRPPYDPVLMFKILVLGTMNNLSDDRIEFMIRDRLSWLRFLGFSLGETMPDGKTIWLFREKLTNAGAFEKLFEEFGELLRARGYESRSGQIADATVVSSPRQRMTDEERARAKKGESASQIWDKPEKARQKDVDARWTMKRVKMRKIDRDGKSGEGGGLLCEMKHGYKNHVSIDRKWRFVRCWSATDAARHDGHELENILDMGNSCKTVWADSAYLSAKNEAMLEEKGFKSQIHRKKPKGKPMPRHVSGANAKRSKMRACVEHVFADQKGPMEFTIRSVGLVRAEGRIAMTNLGYNMRRLICIERRMSAG